MYYLGSITGSSGAYYNNTTGASGIGTFAIPSKTKALYLQASSSGIAFALSAATGATSFLNATNGAAIPANVVCGPYRTVDNPTVGIYNTVGGFISVRVWMAPTS